jgi:hypothetical protein
MAKVGDVFNMVDGGDGFLRTAWLTFIECFRHPFSTSVISPGHQFHTRSLEPAPEIKSDPSVPATRRGLPPVGRGPSATVPPAFKMIVLIVVALTVLSGGCYLMLALMLADPTDLQKAAFETMGTSWKIGFGAIVGLIGGKAVR